MNLNKVILARSVQNRFRLGQKGIHLSQSQTCSRRFSEPDYQRSKEVGMAAWRRSHCFLPRQLSRRHISFPLAKWGTIVGTASASAAHILLSQQRHGHGSRRRQLRVVPKSPRGGERPRHLADVRTRRPNPTANRKPSSRTRFPSIGLDHTIHGAHSRAYKNLPDHTPSQLTKPDQTNLSSQ